MENLKVIRQCNKNREAYNQSFSCAVNKFADLTNEEFQTYITNFPGNLSSSQPREFNEVDDRLVVDRANLPDFVDWRQTAVTPVKDQVDLRST